MKVKVRKRKKSPAPYVTEQARGKVISNIDIQRMTQDIVIPQKVVLDAPEKELTYSACMCIIESILGTTEAIEILKQLESVIKRYNLQHTPKLLECVMRCAELKVISDRSYE